METKVLAFRSWDDLVFDHRNKLYGAYAIRRAYERRLLLGLGLTTALVAILLLTPGLLPETVPVPKLPPILKDPGIRLLDYTPPIKEPKVPKASASSSPANNPNKTVQVVSEPVEDDEDFDSTLPSVSAPREGDGGIVDGIGDDVFIEAIPAVKPKTITSFAEIMPSYQDGLDAMMRFIKRKMRYPASPRRLGIEGTVFVSFVVNGDGSVSDVMVVRGIHRDCDEEAMRVISMLPGWIGGKQGGEPVPVRMVLPIKFSLATN